MPETRGCALIVGASGTLGGRIAAELLARGYDLGLHHCQHEEPCRQLAERARTTGRRASCYAGDLRRVETPGELVAAFLKDFGRLDALVWAAGITHDAPLLTLKDEDLSTVLDVDLRAVFLTLKAASRQFLKQKSGSVVALSSHAALAGRAGGVAYAMAHSGLLALLKSAAREWGSAGVRVNAVVPPFVPASTMGRSASPEFIAGVKARRVLKSDADAAGSLARFVAEVIENPAASGQVLVCDSRI